MKRFIKLFIGLIALLSLTLVILSTVIDPNDYKEDIQSQVKKTVNRELLIKGDLHWRFYPQLGFSSGEIELNNQPGFNRPHLAKIESAAISIDVLPLLKGEIKLGELTLNGLRLNLITNKNGVSNLDNLLPAKRTSKVKAIKQQQPDYENQTQGFFAVNKTQLAGIDIKNTIIEVQNLKTGSTTKVAINHIRLGKFVAGEETDLSVSTDLLVEQIKGHIELQAKLMVAPDFTSLQLAQLNLQTQLTGKTLPNGMIDSTIKSNISYNFTNNTAELTDFLLQLGKINLSGKLSIQATDKTKIRFALHGNEWDLNPYFSPTEKSKDKTTTESKTTGEQEPDLSFINNLDVQGRFALAGLKAAGLTLNKIDTKIKINHGKAEIKPLTANLYQGKLTLNASLAPAQGANSYQIKSLLQNVQIKPLLVDLAKIDLLSGTTAFNFSGSGQGLTQSKLKSSLLGEGDFKLLDGELYGVNVPQEIRSLKAKLTGQPAPTQDNIKKTDFASLSGNFSIKKGVVNNHKLLMLSPVMRLDGLGLANIIKEMLDYKLSITPLSQSDADTQLYDLNGITIPLLIRGSFQAPKFSLDMDGALKAELKNKAKAELKKLQNSSPQEIKQEGKNLEKKLKNELGKFFN